MPTTTEWENAEVGQVFTVKVTTAAGRILGMVTVDVPLQRGFPIEQRVGNEGKQDIELRASELAEAVARAVETNPRA